MSVCIVRGCGFSGMVKGWIMEVLFIGYIVMNVEVVDVRIVKVYWNAFEEVNGVIFYDIDVEGEFYVDRGTEFGI